MSLGPFAVALAVGFLLLGLAYLVNSSRAPRRDPEVPPNLQPYLTDDDLENKRLNKTLVAALLSSAFLAVALPAYFATESGRQQAFVERFEAEALSIGEDIYNLPSADNPEGFGCTQCHGPGGGGGSALFTDPRTGASVSWKAPSLNDVFFRYDEDEVRYWVVWGRAGTPMPAWGTEAGGPLNDQQLDFILLYLESIQLTQEEAAAEVDGEVNIELTNLEGAAAKIEEAIINQQAEIALISMATERFEWATRLRKDLSQVLDSADQGFDTDRDGLSDESELQINRISELAFANVGSDATKASTTARDKLVLELQIGVAFSTSDKVGEAIPDALAAANLLAELDSQLAALGPAAENQDRLEPIARQVLATLGKAADDARYQVDFVALAESAFGGDVAAATRAYGLFSANCARCHTAGYSAGAVSTLEPGSGALGPSLQEGRAVVQFPNSEDHYEFILGGSENGIGYGVNGIGRGWMPAFGTLLSEADLRLIVAFERSLD
jgi:mono/diheme cytochrome c family protein